MVKPTPRLRLFGLGLIAATVAQCQQPSTATELLICILMLGSTCLLHLAITTLLAELSHHKPVISWCAPHRHRRSMVVLGGAGLIGLTLLADILLWALLLRALGLLTSLESSFYFSGITFTSVGYGDVTLPECWRLLSVGLGLNGVLMAGWSTALLMFLVQRMMELRLSSHRSRD